MKKGTKRRRAAQPVESLPRRRRLTAQQLAQQVLDREQLRKLRERALLDADVQKKDIERVLLARGKHVSHTTVTNVIKGVFRNADVASVFCELTRTQLDEMFPPLAAASSDV